jgi:hypothetical protein
MLYRIGRILIIKCNYKNCRNKLTTYACWHVAVSHIVSQSVINTSTVNLCRYFQPTIYLPTSQLCCLDLPLVENRLVTAHSCHVSLKPHPHTQILRVWLACTHQTHLLDSQCSLKSHVQNYKVTQQKPELQYTIMYRVTFHIQVSVYICTCAKFQYT